MGLFHCLDPHVTQLVFQVAHLDKPFLIKGMNGKPMEMKSLLLMLAPEGLSERENEILSLISTSLIENQASMMIYSLPNIGAFIAWGLITALFIPDGLIPNESRK